MNSVQTRLALLRFKLRLVTLGYGGFALLALAVGSAVVVGVADWNLRLPVLVRALALVATLVAAGTILWQTLLHPWFRRWDDLSLALRVEEANPELNDALASTVEFLQGAGETGSSPAIRQRAIDQAMEACKGVNFNRVLPLKGLGLGVLCALVALAPAVYFWYAYPVQSQTALARFFDPFGEHTWTRLVVPPLVPRIAQGQSFRVPGEIQGVLPQQVRLEIEGFAKNDRLFPVKLSADKQTAYFVTPFDMPTLKGMSKVRFRIHANDAVFPRAGVWQELEIFPPPRFALLDGMPSPQVELNYPAYTDLASPHALSPGQGHVDAVAGTEIRVRAMVDRPLAKAWIDLRPEKSRVAPLLAGIGLTQSWSPIVGLVVGQAVAGRAPCQIDAAGLLVSGQFTGYLPGQYVLHVQDVEGLWKDFPYELRIFADPPPAVQLQRPATSMSLVPDATVHFKVAVEDEIFAVRSASLVYRVKAADGKWQEGEPTRVPIFEPALAGRELPAAFAKLGGVWLPEAGHRLRPKRLELFSKWPLAGRFKEGESVFLRIEADDFNNILSPRPVGTSHEIELRIVPKQELARELDQDFSKIQEQLLQLQQQQAKANELLDDVKRNRDKPGEANHDKVVETEQIQKSMQQRIGQRPDEGMRQEIANLKQKIRDNQLPNSGLKDRLQTIDTELGRLADETLPQIENKLVETRKELAGLSKPNPKGPDPIDQARVLQEDSKKTIDELLKFLDPWTKTNVVKGQMQDLQNQQKDVQTRTETLKQALEKTPNDPELKAEQAKLAEEQQRLAAKAKDLVSRLEEMKNQQKDNPDLGKVGDALDLANKQDSEQKGLADEMKQAGDLMKQKPNPQETHPLAGANRKQENANQRLQQMMDALEEKRDDQIDKLRKKQKEAEQKLADLTEEMEKLQKKVKEAGKIADPMKRAEELKNLAGEQRRLKEQAQEQSRDLSRLQADQASKDLAQAAREMERALQKLEAGEDAEQIADLQDQALDRLDQGMENLDEAEEELAREQLARIADQIKGLKERQDSAIAATERIHTDLMRGKEGVKKWTRGLHNSLANSAQVQANLKKEAESLREKIKEAKVLDYILRRAGESMEQAELTIKERKETVDYAPLDKEALADEDKMHKTTLRHQKDAQARLERLLEAMKDEPLFAKNENNDPGQQNQPMNDEPMGGFKAQDGVPPSAQIKALRDEQTDIKRRTEEFAKLHPDVSKLTPKEREELKQLEEEQSQIHQLFSQITGQKEAR